MLHIMSSSSVNEIYESCDSFVTQYAPNRTPRLESNNEQLFLYLSFTPAKNNEVSRIIDALQNGPSKFHIPKESTSFIATEINDMFELVIPVKSKASAQSLLNHLCFEDNQLYDATINTGKWRFPDGN